MAKVVTTPLTQLSSNETSAVAEINANFDAVDAAIENTLSRDGTSPNGMTADFDMNSNDILNAGSISATSLVLGSSTFTESGITLAVQEEGVTVSTSATLNVVGTLATVSDVGGVATLTIANPNHDSLAGFVANEHVDHSAITLTAGEGLTGGGDLTANRTFDLDANALTADATPDGAADYVITYDADAGSHKKVLLDNLPGSGGTPEGTAILSTGEVGGTKFLREDGDGTSSWQAVPGGGDALTANPLSQFAATTSAQLAGVISDETGSGGLVFATSPTLVTPALGTPSAAVLTNATGLPVAGLAAGTDGELITWDASGNPATVAVGTSGHVLTSNGVGAAPTFQASAGGGGGANRTVWAEDSTVSITVLGDDVTIPLDVAVDRFRIELEGLYFQTALTADFLCARVTESGVEKTTAGYYTYDRTGYDDNGNTNAVTAEIADNAVYAAMLGDLSGNTTIEDAITGHIDIVRLGTDLQCTYHLKNQTGYVVGGFATPGAAAAPDGLVLFAGTASAKTGQDPTTDSADRIKVLTKQSVGGGGTPKFCVVSNSVALTAKDYTSGTVAVTFDQDDADANGWHDTVSNTSRITPSSIPSGYVDVNCSIGLSSVTAGLYTFVNLNKNGSRYAEGTGVETGVSASSVTASWLMVPFSPGDYFEIVVTQETDTSVTVSAASNFVVREVL